MDPISVIGLLGQCYSAVVQAYLFIQTAIAFPDTAAKLVIQLEVERIRLQLWGRNSGADSDALRPGLAPFEPLIVDILTRIQQLLCDSEKLKTKYGLSSSMDGVAGTIRSKMPRSSGLLQVVDNVKDILRSAFTFTGSATDEGKMAEIMIDAPRANLVREGLDRLSWAIVSKSRFESLIVDLRGFNNNLNELLRESQFLELSRQWHTLEMRAVACSNNTVVLKALQAATDGDENCREIFSMAKRKSIIIADEVLQDEASKFDPGNHMILSQTDFELPANFPELSRCIAVYKPLISAESQGYVLIERKTYQSPEMSQLRDKSRSLFNHHTLIKLVNSSLSQNLLCQGYWRGDLSWYFVYQFPLQSIAPAPSSLSTHLTPCQPLSLHLILTHATFRPPLEVRVTLACALAASFLRFYGSKWLHKAVRSENVVFPASRAGGAYDIAHPVVVGFTEFSRPLQQVTITIPHRAGRRGHVDENYVPLHPVLGRLPPEYGIYYHPAYLNPRQSKPYSMAFDIYSFGLVLLEVGWWFPLERVPGALQAGRMLQTASLRQDIIAQVKKDLGFNMGTAYKEVVEWCLARDEGPRSDSDLAVEFYAKVVVPLSSISR
ncbi:prion-inhibition and propagation-domain-containing protein [Mycena vulgaris]|nr:prion-inhibition and propagation-domain-containing protein [Mycena vulgaris]